jgi:hypothetical protein
VEAWYVSRMAAAEPWKRELVRLMPHVAKRVDASLSADAAAIVEELREIDIELPDDLVALLAAIDDGSVIDLEALGGETQHLHDLDAVLECNHPEEGTYGTLVASGEIPKGVVMIGYGMTQLLFDAVGALGPKGGFWSAEDMVVDTNSAKRLAASLVELLRGAKPIADHT